jgi:hypothetical protein
LLRDSGIDARKKENPPKRSSDGDPIDRYDMSRATRRL